MFASDMRKYMMCAFFTTLICFKSLNISWAQVYQPDWVSLNTRKIPAWFQNDKFGIFIHWGVYSVPSFSTVTPDGYSEWYWCNYNDAARANHTAVKSFHDKTYGPGFQYQQFAASFKAELFNPGEWAAIFKKSGARYVVLTSKHHDGFTLWPSKEADLSWGGGWTAVSNGPHRDLAGELTRAVKNTGLKMGFYYSLMEWYNPVFKKDKITYVDSVMIPQLRDLVTRYKPSLIFADGEWGMEDKDWKSTQFLAWLYNESPVASEVVVNDRWGRTTRQKHPSTYYTSEYGSGLGKSVIWEESRGMAQSYGYNRMEKLSDYKTADQLILILADIVSKGGNLLLDIGPAADGTIPVIMEERLTQMGSWLSVNGEAIFGTRPWRQEKQWSAGKKPVIKEGSYQTQYDITEWINKSEDKAFIQMFFTQKDTNLYCIIPAYVESVFVDNLKLSSNSVVSILGVQQSVIWKREKSGVAVNLSRLKPGMLPGNIIVLKVTNVL